MDFVEWCDFVLNKLIEAQDMSPEIRSIGADQYHLARTIFGLEFTNQPEFQASTHQKAMFDAIRELEQVHLIERSAVGRLMKVTRLGRELSNSRDMIPFWQAICQERLGPEEEQLVKAVNKMSPHSTQDHAWLEEINHSLILAELGWLDDVNSLWPLVQELEQTGLIADRSRIGRRIDFQATYRGLVWETKRSFTAEAQFIDELVAEWETTSVEFKSDVSTDTAGQIAEFIKDVLSLATTKTSGRRWMIIGFDDDIHEYCDPPNPKLTQNHLEQLLQEYTKPMVQVRYQVVDYRKGPVGKLEVFRDARHLPYKVAKSLGSQNDKRRISEGAIYVRHGSQVQPPTPEELEALQEEGVLARRDH
jgi:hypothetical protein